MQEAPHLEQVVRCQWCVSVTQVRSSGGLVMSTGDQFHYSSKKLLGFIRFTQPGLVFKFSTVTPGLSGYHLDCLIAPKCLCKCWFAFSTSVSEARACFDGLLKYDNSFHSCVFYHFRKETCNRLFSCTANIYCYMKKLGYIVETILAECKLLKFFI